MRSTAWSRHGERPIYENEWVTLSLVDVQPPGQERFEHHVVTLKPAAMVALLNEHDQVLLMWRHRFATNVWNWELPGGIVEHGEDPAVTAAREAVEETGYRPLRLEHVVTFEPNIGMVRNAHHVYVSRGAERVGDPTETTEMQRMEWVSLGDVLALIKDGKILNSGTLVALLHLLATRTAAGGSTPTA
ncbi:NUDIX hydrolase [Kineosporia sp. A_224]|uniref:NUDIX hydrolase n=1 Tax=Kineosporia sp. A_224 TaxID=1962180 RepID=UPI000B4BCFE3|nr:NUDIX hydrolase [Kineosporia sp. A_224]